MRWFSIEGKNIALPDVGMIEEVKIGELAGRLHND